MGSRAVVVLCRDAAVGARRFGAADGRSGIVTTRTGRPFFPDERREAEVLDRAPRGGRRRGVLGALRHGLDLPRRRDPPVVRQGPGAPADAVRGGRVERAGLARTPPSAWLEPATLRDPETAALLERTRERREGWSATSTPTAATAGPSRDRTTCGSRPSTSSRRRGGSTSTGTTCGTWRPWRTSPAPTPACSSPTAVAGGRGHRPRERGGGDGVVGGPDRPRGRGDGGEVPGLGGEGPAGTRPAGRQVPRPRVPPDHLRPGVHRPRAPGTAARAFPRRPSAPSRSGSTRWAWRGSTASWSGNPSSASTPASSGSWRWSPSPSTRVSDRSVRPHGGRCARTRTGLCSAGPTGAGGWCPRWSSNPWCAPRRRPAARAEVSMTRRTMPSVGLLTVAFLALGHASTAGEETAKPAGVTGTVQLDGKGAAAEVEAFRIGDLDPLIGVGSPGPPGAPDGRELAGGQLGGGGGRGPAPGADRRAGTVLPRVSRPRRVRRLGVRDRRTPRGALVYRPRRGGAGRRDGPPLGRTPRAPRTGVPRGRSALVRPRRPALVRPARRPLRTGTVLDRRRGSADRSPPPGG